MGLIVVSDDLPELLQNCDRILVMFGGKVVKSYDAEAADEDILYRTMTAPELEVAR